MVTINACVQTICLYFILANRHSIPSGIKVIAEKGGAGIKLQKRPRVSASIRAEECAVSNTFLYNLERLGFELVDAVCTEKIQSASFVVRFLFCRRELAEPTLQFTAVRDRFRLALPSMTANRVWKFKAYDNQYYRYSKEVDGCRALNLNFSDPRPDPAKFFLVIDQDSARLMPAE